MPKKILVVGGGGREHALVWKLHQDGISDIFVAPGNAGTSKIAMNINIPALNIPELVKFAKKNKIYLTIVGLDDALALGIVDAFQKEGLRVFGPTRAAAQIESSKSFAKDLMRKKGIPTASFEVFERYNDALQYVRELQKPCVIKASGLALGKGVKICMTVSEAEEALNEIMVAKKHGEAGNKVVIEEYLRGNEFSVHVIASGKDFILFPFSQDHKQINDGDQGPMTGGIGAIAPIPGIKNSLQKFISREIVKKVLDALAKNGTPFAGCLYPGMMQTADGPKVLEFNARFGDPETQVLMRLLQSSLLDLLDASVDGKIGRTEVKWKPGAAACIILASGGYPDNYRKGFPITGIEEAEKIEGVTVFHAGTKLSEKGEVLTAGGRVLGVSAYADTLSSALELAYKAAGLIHFEAMHYRKDIGHRSVIIH